jgi:4-diphosphocytidyl-2-C-methyl-D-erythritol kinase
LNIVIHKRIPIMSGLGGSATDVAAIISWIVKKYHFKLTSLHLKYIALNIGSDIPFFLAGYDSAWVSEYGNKIIENKKLIPKFKVIFSNIPINTTQVYRSMKNRYISKVNIKKAYEDLNKKKNCHDVIYNDMWTFANKLSKQLKLFSDKLSKTKKIILTGSGGSFVEII